jgi:hypothetical protein
MVVGCSLTMSNAYMVGQRLSPMCMTHSMCHNPNLGLATKARACEGAGQK